MITNADVPLIRDLLCYLAAAEHDAPVLSSAAGEMYFSAAAEHDDPALSSAASQAGRRPSSSSSQPPAKLAGGKERHGKEKPGRPSSSSSQPPAKLAGASLPPAKLAGETERQSTTTGRRASLLLITLVFFFCCPTPLIVTGAVARLINVTFILRVYQLAHTSDLGILAWISGAAAGCSMSDSTYVVRD